MNDSLEAAARALLSTEATKTITGLEGSEVVCLLHDNATVLYGANGPCPLCRATNPNLITHAVKTLARAPAPIAAVMEAVEAMEPVTRQLREDRGITALGHTVADVERLGAAQVALREWLHGSEKSAPHAYRDHPARPGDCHLCSRGDSDPVHELHRLRALVEFLESVLCGAALAHGFECMISDGKDLAFVRCEADSLCAFCALAAEHQ